jgi:Mg-chelatase subunit ChlD
MFFADTSGSMASPDYHGDEYGRSETETKIELLRRAFDSYLNNCTAALNAVGLATFPEQAYEVPTQNYAELRNLIRQLIAEGGTPLAAAMNYVCENEPITHGVIISDGDADDRELPIAIAKKFASKLVKIDTVHIGSSSGGEALLKEIAEITGGIYVKFTDVNNFAKTFQYLSPAKRGLLTSSKNPVALLGAADVKL